MVANLGSTVLLLSRISKGKLKKHLYHGKWACYSEAIFHVQHIEETNVGLSSCIELHYGNVFSKTIDESVPDTRREAVTDSHSHTVVFVIVSLYSNKNIESNFSDG